MKLRIAETFTSIQGEGQWVGVPSYFIRVSGCNLRCTWCDTPYASWHPEGDFVPLADLVSGVDVQHVVITGGEPMLFDAVVELCAMLRGEGHALPPGEEGVPRRAGGRAVDNGGPASTSLPLVGGEDSGIASIITIETAGTIFRELECDLMSISPKLRNSTPVGGKYTGRTNQLPMDPQWESRHERDRINIPVLRQLTQRYNYQLKFVVSDPQDIAEIEGLIAEIGGIDPARVFLMPEGVTSEILRERGKWLSPICIQRGWRLGPRLHVDLFGDTKGT